MMNYNDIIFDWFIPTIILSLRKKNESVKLIPGATYKRVNTLFT